MRIRVSEIPRDGLDVFSVHGRERIPRLLEGMDPYPLQAVRLADATLFLSAEGRNVFVNGSFVAEGDALCDRCTDPFTVRIAREFSGVLVPREESPPGPTKVELGGEDLEIAYHDGEGIEVGDIFWEQVGLSLPVKLLCREECGGVCPRCGANRDREPCGCPADEAAGPFGVLKSLLKDRK